MAAVSLAWRKRCCGLMLSEAPANLASAAHTGGSPVLLPLWHIRPVLFALQHVVRSCFGRPFGF